MKPRRVLVPLDGRRASEAALPTAIELARESGGSLYLLRVLAIPAPTVEGSVRHRAAVQRAERYLAITGQRLRADGLDNLSTAVWSGSPAAAIVKAADLTEADMIVMAAAGATGPPRQMVGSVVERVLRGTRRPVLVVIPPDAAIDPPPDDAAPVTERPAPAGMSFGSSTPEAPRGDRPPDREYLDVLHELQPREVEILRMTAQIQRAAKDLERWQAVFVAHAGVGFPKEVTMIGRSIDASTWPTARALAETLAAWHDAAESARAAWARLPSAARACVPPPP